MLFHAIKIIFRNLTRNRFYSVSIIIGFGIAISMCYLITAFLIHETSVDDFHAKKENIYRMLMKDPVLYSMNYVTTNISREKILSDFSEVVSITNLTYPGPVYVKSGDKEFKEIRLLYADSAFLEIFDFDLLAGNKSKVLNQPYSVILSQLLAQKYFGEEEVLGNTLFINGMPCTVTGVMRSPSGDSHLRFDILLSGNSLSESSARFTYLLLKEGSDPTELVHKLNANVADILLGRYGVHLQEPFGIQRLKDCFYSDVTAYHSNVFASQDKKTLNHFAIVMLIILFIASFNYINFSQARALFRSKEIVIQRLLGAGKLAIFFQFILESLLLCCVAAMISFILILIVLPIFNDMTGVQFKLPFLLNTTILGRMAGIIILISFVLGTFTYLLYTRIQIVNLMKGVLRIGPGHIRLLNGLVILQLAISVTLMLISTMIWKQIGFIEGQPLGYYKENMIDISLMELPENVDPQGIKNEILKNHEVESAAVCMGTPITGRGYRSWPFGESEMEYTWLVGDIDFISTVGFEIIHGRGFQSMADSNAVILNERAFKLFEFDEDFVSEQPAAPENVIGVVKDFHFKSFREHIGPVNITLKNVTKVEPWGASKLIVRVNGDVGSVKSKIEKQWKEMFSDTSFDFTITSQDFHSTYKEDRKQATLIMTGCLASIVITLFGLLGLSFYSAHRRSKEIAIRKVHGATSFVIIRMFLKQAVGWTLLGSVLAVPVAIHFIHQWLNAFAYRTETPVWLHAIVISLAVLLTVLTTLYQTRLAAYSNPADVLRTE